MRDEGNRERETEGGRNRGWVGMRRRERGGGRGEEVREERKREGER